MATNEFAPKRAVKSQVKLKIAIQGPSGSGKTEGALALATHLLHAMGYTTPEQLEGKITVVDTENDSASLYADRYIFNTVSFRSPYTPERYIAAMTAGLDSMFLIVDSITQEWNGEGGIMAQVDAKKGKGNDFNAWATVTPRHDAFVEWIKQAPIDIIVTMRSKQNYVLESNDRGKQVPRKVGMAPIQRDGLEYEFALVFDLDMQNRATTSKNRTGLFADEQLDLKGDASIAQKLLAWRNSGAAYVAPPVAPVTARPAAEPEPNCITGAQGQAIWTAMKAHDKTVEDLKADFRVHSLRYVLASDFDAVLKWAGEPRTKPKAYQDGEENCRAAAKVFGLSEPDLMFELATNRGDWHKTHERIKKLLEEQAADLAAQADNEEALAEQAARSR